jgi:hypothetical protein
MRVIQDSWYNSDYTLYSRYLSQVGFFGDISSCMWLLHDISDPDYFYDIDICRMHCMLIIIEDVTLIKNAIVYFKHNNTFLYT